VCELTDVVGVDQSTVSKHLTVLKQAGLVAARKEGTSSYYRVTCKCLEGFFQWIESVLEENLKNQRLAVREFFSAHSWLHSHGRIKWEPADA